MRSHHALSLLTLMLLALPAVAQVSCPYPVTRECEALQRDDELRRAREARDEEQRKREERNERDRQLDVRLEQERRREEPLRREQERQLAQSDAAIRALRTSLLATAPVPAGRNPLLGRWRIAEIGGVLAPRRSEPAAEHG